MSQAWLALAIFLICYGIIISEKINRSIIAMVGGVAMVLFGLVTQESALHHIDWNTIGLLVGMMILVAVLMETGVFEWIGYRLVQAVRGEPKRLFFALCLLTAFLSAFLDNVTTVLVTVPLSFAVTRSLQLNVMPFLIGQILASNIGGTATLIGDPPNIMIGGSVPELTFMAFLVNLGPIALIVLLVILPILMWMYRDQFRAGASKYDPDEFAARPLKAQQRKLLWKAGFVFGLTIAGFLIHNLLHLESATIALAGAFLLMLISGEAVFHRAIKHVEWEMILFFVGLFVLVGGLVDTGIIKVVADQIMAWTGGDEWLLTVTILWMSGILSGIIDNIPYVATLIPMVKEIGAMGVTNLEPIWWSLALGACLGGNATIIGAFANVIVSGIAAREGEPIRFWAYLKIAFPLTMIMLVLCHVYLWIRYF